MLRARVVVVGEVDDLAVGDSERAEIAVARGEVFAVREARHGEAPHLQLRTGRDEALQVAPDSQKNSGSPPDSVTPPPEAS